MYDGVSKLDFNYDCWGGILPSGHGDIIIDHNAFYTSLQDIEYHGTELIVYEITAKIFTGRTSSTIATLS